MSNAIQRLLERASTVAELIEELQMLDPESKIIFTSDYGDRCKTQQAFADYTVDELDPESETLAETGYSGSGVCVQENDEAEDSYSDEFDNVVIFRL